MKFTKFSFFKKKKKEKRVVQLNCKYAKGTVLLAYLKDSVLLEDDAIQLNFHSNMWESREIARIFNRLGYNVDAINYDDFDFKQKKKYDIVFDIYKNLGELKWPENCIKILHLTGSYAKYNNEQETNRREYLFKRKNVNLPIERYADIDIVDKSLGVANIITIVGNSHTVKTFPEEYQGRINCIPVTSSKLNFIKEEKDYLPNEKEFLWLAGFGAVHKGLDLLLDVFSQHPDWTLNVVGSVENEKEFVNIFQKELYETPNIKYHGFLSPSSDEFINITKKCFCYINPSCAESTSTASITALSVGLYPLISYDNGIDLPNECGIYLKDCSIEEIENAIEKIITTRDKDIKLQIRKTQDYILKTFSRENFTKIMTETLLNKGL